MDFAYAKVVETCLDDLLKTMNFSLEKCYNTSFMHMLSCKYVCNLRLEPENVYRIPLYVVSLN